MSNPNLFQSHYNEEPQSEGGIEGFRIKSVLHETLLALVNKLFRLECPPERNLRRYQQLMEKALQPHVRQKSWEFIFQELSLAQQESIVAQCVEATVGVPSNSLDQWLTVLMTLEDIQTYQADTILHSDLALLATYHQGGLHGERFKCSVSNPERLAHLLMSEGYDNSYFSALEGNDTALAYWLSRRLQYILPWSGILNLLDAEPQQVAGARWLSLYRFKQIYTVLAQHSFFSRTACSSDTLAQGLQLLKDLQTHEFSEIGSKLGLSWPLSVLVLVEGNTEVLVLPAIAKTLGIDLAAEGIEIIPVGGKSQMLNTFLGFTETLNAPIVVVLDQDAAPLKPDLDYYRRPQDRIVLLSGEIEDTYSQELIEKTIRQFYLSEMAVADAFNMVDTDASVSKTVGALEKYWQQHGLGRFNKITFAAHLSQVLQAEQMVSPAMKAVIESIFEAKGA